MIHWILGVQPYMREEVSAKTITAEYLTFLYPLEQSIDV
jgi:hypothetical protein